MAVNISHNIDTINSTIGTLTIAPNANVTTALAIAGIDIGTGLQNAYNTANGAFARANSGGGTGGAITFQVDTSHPGALVNTGAVVTITGNNTLILGMNAATTLVTGVVQLNDTTLSTSSSLAATANSVNTAWAYAQSAYTRANTLDGIVSLTLTATGGLTVNTGSFFNLGANGTFALSTNTATTGAVGVVQLNDTVQSTSATTAATANSVNTAWAYAQSSFNLANSTTNLVTGAYNTANSGQNLALSAFTEANSFQSVINSSFNLANTIQGEYATSNNVVNMAGQANTRGVGSRVAYANGNFANTGDAQFGIILLRNQSTSSGNTINLSTTGSNSTTSVYGSINQLQLSNNAIYAFSGMVVARDVTNMFGKIWEVKGGIKNVVGPKNTTPVSNTNIMGSPVINIIAADNGTNTWVLTLSTDLANNALLFLASGSANNTNWVARIDTTEVA